MKFLINLFILLIQRILTANDDKYSSINCKSNPLLKLRLFADNKINSSLYSTPIRTSNNFCKAFGEFSCCSSDSFNIFTNLITEQINKKRNIYDSNLVYFSLIIKEHLRNFKAFNIRDDLAYSYLSLYSNYSLYLNDLAKNITFNSIKWQWSSFCNYICNPNYQSLCTYDQNNILSCNMDLDLISDILNYTIIFHNEMKNSYLTLTSIYEDMKKKTKDYQFNNTNVSIVISVNGTTKDFMYKDLLINSLNDGKYVSLNFSMNPFACESLNMCKIILEKFCVPFRCFDDNFLQFNQYGSISTEQSLAEGSFTNFTYNLIGSTSNKSLDFYNFSKFTNYLNFTNFTQIFKNNYINVSDKEIFTYYNLGKEIDSYLQPLNFSLSFRYVFQNMYLVLLILLI